MGLSALSKPNVRSKRYKQSGSKCDMMNVALEETFRQHIVAMRYTGVTAWEANAHYKFRFYEDGNIADWQAYS